MQAPASLRAQLFPITLLTAALCASPGLRAADCPSDIGVNDCVANDLQPTGTEIINGPTACTEGDVFSATVRVLFEDGGGANARYSVGFYVGDNGEAAIGGASCTFDSLQPVGPPIDLTGGSGGFQELNGDQCGDIDKNEVTYKDIQLDQLLCEDEDGDGNVDVSYVLTWVNNGNQENCTDPLDPLQFEPNPPKCLSDLEYDLPIIVEKPPSIEVGKGAFPSTLVEPGGEVTFRFSILNTSPSSSDPVEIVSIQDVPYGDLTNQTDCTLPFILAPGESRTCNYVRDIMGTAGQSFPDTVTVLGRDDEGNGVSGSDTAVVEIIDDQQPEIPADLRIVKFAAPAELPEPGGNVTYSVIAANVSPTPMTLTSLVDDLYGDLNGQGNCSVPQFLGPGSFGYSCSFTQPVTGQPGDVITDTIIGRGTNGLDDGGELASSDQASVTIFDLGSDIEIAKIANPATVTEPGDMVEFSLQIQNKSVADEVTINTLLDVPLGDPTGIPGSDCSLPIVLPPGGTTYTCTYSGMVSGNAGDQVTNVIFAAGVDDDGALVGDFDGATVTIIGAIPRIEVVKAAIPPFVLAPGGDVLFLVGVQNRSSSSDPVTITSLEDNIHSPLTGSSCELPPGGIVLAPPPDPNSFFACSFVRTVNGVAGDQEIDIVTVMGEDDEGTPVSASADAVVRVANIALPDPDLRLFKFAAPIEVPEPGADVTYVVLLANASDPGSPGLEITVNELVDDIYGPLDGQGTCSLPIVIPVGAIRSCYFTVPVTGDVGEVITDIITARGVTTLGAIPVEASDDASVTITDVPSSMVVTKTAEPTSVLEPGEDVTFTIVVGNNSEADDIVVETLVDNIHGDLNGQGTCSMPQALAQGSEPYRCEFTVFVGGEAGDEELNTVVATAIDENDLPLEASAQADVVVIGLPPAISVIKTANPNAVPAEGGRVVFTFTTTNASEADILTINTLTDSVFGDLDGRGTCEIPQVLQPGESYICRILEDISGVEGEAHLDEVQVSGTAEDGDLVSDRATAIVRFVAALEAIPLIGQLGLAALALLIALLGIRAARRR